MINIWWKISQRILHTSVSLYHSNLFCYIMSILCNQHHNDHVFPCSNGHGTIDSLLPITLGMTHEYFIPNQHKVSPKGRLLRGSQHNKNSQIVVKKRIDPNNKIHGANMGPILGRQDLGGPHAGPMNFANWGRFDTKYFPQFISKNWYILENIWLWDGASYVTPRLIVCLLFDGTTFISICFVFVSIRNYGTRFRYS